MAPVLQIVSTNEELAAALLVRKSVFVDEQGVSPELEIDEYDVLGGDTTHAIVLLGEQVVAAGRLRPVGTQLGKLERIAVLNEHRGCRFGIALTRYLEELALHRGLVRLTMNAQQSARNFYAKLGYVADGPEFLEAGIVHTRMMKTLL